jgi:uncharacterized protein
LLHPPELEDGRRRCTAAAEARDIAAQYRLGRLLATRLDPPELEEARRWFTAAAEVANSSP